MRYGNNRRFDNERNGSGYQSGGGRNYNQGQRRGNVRGAFRPNTGKAGPNERRRNSRDPAFTGVGNVVCPDGSKMTIFISVWENDDGSLGLAFKDANADQYQGQQQRQPRDRNGRDYDHYDERPRQQDNYRDNYRDGGAMSRARPIPPAQFQGQYDDRNPPPADDYPTGPDDYQVNYEPDNNGSPF